MLTLNLQTLLDAISWILRNEELNISVATLSMVLTPSMSIALSISGYNPVQKRIRAIA
jgi:hypothetical protein